MPIVWSAIEAAIYAAVHNAAGVTTYWADQKIDRQARPFVVLRHDVGHTLGTVPDLLTTFDAAQVGAELQNTTIEPVEFLLSVQTFSAATVGDASAMAIMAKIRNAFRLGSVVDSLLAAGVAIADRGGVQNLSELLDNRMESRAAMDVRCRAVDGATDANTYIQTVGPIGSTFNP